MRRPQGKIQAQDQALTIIAGDFNVVCHPHDRFNKATGVWTGNQDEHANTEFQRLIAEPFGLHEGHMSAWARSRSRRERLGMLVSAT